ncbi:hypothetical protein Bbelb_022130, partial [Branchiostoma belcheri]
MWKFRKSIKAYAVFNITDFTFYMGIETAGVDPFRYQYKVADAFWGEEKELDTGIKIDFTGDPLDLRMRFKLEYQRPSRFFITLSLGLCGEQCMEFIHLLKHMLIPVPKKDANGNLVMPEINMEELAKTVVKTAMSDIAAMALRALGLPSDLLDGSKTCMFPDRLTVGQLKAELTNRSLATTGNQSALVQRLKTADSTCDYGAHLPAVPDRLNHSVYCKMDHTCLGISCCTELSIKSLNFTRAFNLWLRLDACNFQFVIGFETLEYRKLLFTYPWGKPEEIKLAEGVIVTLTINKTATDFIVDVGVMICMIGGECVIEGNFIRKLVVPIPICNKISLDAASIDRFIQQAGENVASGLVDLIVDNAGLQDIFYPAGQVITLPKRTLPGNCSLAPSFDWLPQGFSCQVNAFCLGLDCIMNMNLLNYTNIATLAYINLDFCNYTFNIGLGNWSYHLALFTYPWGKVQEKVLGEDAFHLRYSIGKNDVKRVFVVNFNVTLCIEGTCSKSNPLISNMEIPQPFCNTNLSTTIPDLSVSGLQTYVQEQGYVVGQVLAETSKNALLQILGIDDIVEDHTCQRPVVLQSGWSGLDKCTDMNAPTLPSTMTCTVQSNCLGLTCCLDMNLKLVNITLKASAVLDMCNYTLSLTLGKRVIRKMLFIYEWGKREEIPIGDAFKIYYYIKKNDAEKKFLVTVEIALVIDGDVEAVYPLLKDSKIPQLFCDPQATLTFLDGVRTAADYIQAVGITEATQVTSTTMAGLFSALQISDVIQEGISHLPPVSSVLFMGWIDVPLAACPDVAWHELATGVVCEVTSPTCTGVTCYREFDLSLESFESKTWMDFDPCDYRLTVGVGLKTVTYSVLPSNTWNYTWGETKTVKFGTVFNLTFAIGKEGDNFVFDFSLRFCKDAASCTNNTFLQKTKVPQPTCYKQDTWTPTTGSVSTAITQMKQAASRVRAPAVLPGVFVEAADRIMGLVQVFTGATDCTGSTSGWTGANNCPAALLPTLPTGVGCAASDGCYSVTCCMTLDLCSIRTVKPNFHVTFDPCTYSMSVGMGKWTSEFNLYQYTWGQTETIAIASVLSFTYSIQKLDSENVFQISSSFRLSCGTSSALNIPIMHNTKVPYKTDCAAVSIPDTVDAFLALQGGQVGNAGQDYVMRGLGLADTFAGHSCSHQGGWHGLDACPSTFQPPTLPSSVDCRFDDLCMGMSCCVDFDLKVGTFRTTAALNFDPCKLTLSARIGGTDFTGLDLYSYTWGTEQTQNAGVNDELRLTYTISYDKPAKTYYLSFSVATCVDTCTTPVVILSQAGFPEPACVQETPVLPGAGTIQDLITQYSDNLGDAALQPAYRYWGLPEDFNPQDTCVVPATSPSCDLDLSTLNLPDTYQYSLHDSCTGIETCVNCDLQVQARSSKVAVSFDPCDMTLTLALHTMSHTVKLYDFEWEVEHIWEVGNLYQLKYTLRNDLEARQYRIDLEVVTCLDPDSCQSCGHVMQNSVFPKPTCDSEASCELDDSNPGLSVTAYLNSFGADTTDAAAEEALANVYRCQGIPYMMTESCTAQADNCRWTSSHSEGTDCGAENSCTGITCCHEFDYKIITKHLSVFFDIDPCTYIISHGIGSQTFTHTFFDFPWGEEQRIRIEKAFFIKYTVVDEGSAYRVSYFVAQCKDDTCQNGWDLLSDQIVTKRQCTNETCRALQLPGDGSLSGFATELAGTVNGYVDDAVFCKLDMTDQLGGEECSLQPSGVGPSECASITLPNIPGLHCEINPGCLGFDCCMEIDLKVKTWSFRMGVTYDPETYRVEAVAGNRKHDYEPFLYPWGEEQTDTVGPITVKYNVDYPAGGLRNSMKFTMELDVSIDGAREPNMPLTIEATSAHPLVDSPYVLPDTADSFLGENGNELKKQAVYRFLGVSDLYTADDCSHSVQTNIPDACVEQNGTLPSEPGNLTCSYTDQCSSVECCLSVDFKTGRRSFRVWYQIDVNTYKLTVGLGSYEFTNSLLLPMTEEREETIGDVFTIRYNIESLTDDQQYNTNLKVIFNSGEGEEEEFILLDNILMPEEALDPGVPFKIQGISVEPIAFYPLNTQLGGMDVTKTGDNAVLHGTSPGTGLNNEDGGSQTIQDTADSRSHIDFPNNGKLESRSSITILVAIRPSTLDQSAPIFDYRGGSVGPDVHGLYLWLSPNGSLSANLQMQTQTGVEDVTFQSEEDEVTAGEWNFVGVSYDNVTATGYLWVDGEAVGEVRHPPGRLATDTSARAGYAEDAEGNRFAFSGNLACVQVWNLSLTGQQVGEAMNFCPYTGSFSITAWPETVAKFLQSVHYDPAGPIVGTVTKAVFRHYDMYDYLEQDECDTASLTARACPDLSLKQDDTVFLQPADQCLGVQGCVKLNYAVKTYSFGLSFSLDPNSFTVRYSFGGQQFTADLFEVANGEIQTQRISSSIELKWTAHPLEFGELISVNLDLHFTTDNHLVIHSILKNVSLSNKAIEQSDASTFANVLSKVKDFPESLPDADYLSFTGSQLGLDAAILRQPSTWEEELTMPTFTAGSTCILKTAAESIAELSNNMVTCVALEHCVGIQCQASVDLKVVEPVFLVSLKINPCLPDVGTTIRFENEQHYLNFSSTYDISEGPFEILDFGDHIKLQYSILRGPDQTFVTTLNLLMCVNNICAVNVPILDELAIPRPPYCTRRRRDVQATEEGLSLVKTPQFVPLMIHTLDNGLEIQAQQCKHMLHVNYDPKAPDCPGLPQVWHQQKKCLPYRNCRGISCCVHLDPDHTDLMSHVSLDMETCGRHLTIRVGNWSFTETIPKAHKRFSQKEKIGEAIQVLYAAMNPDGHRVVVDFKLHVCDHESSERHCHKVEILKDAVIPLFACREEKLVGDTARASSLRYKVKAARRIPGPKTTAVQVAPPSGKYKELAAYRKQQEAMHLHHSLVKRSATATNPVLNMTFLDIRKTLDLNNIDPILAFNLMKSLKELLADLVNEAIDLLLSKDTEELFKSLDLTFRGGWEYPRQTINFFSYSQFFLVGGLVPMTFGFGADGFYGVLITLKAEMGTMGLTGTSTPYIGITVWGELGIGALMYGKLRLEGDIMQTRFPTVAEMGFSKFPFDIGMTLDVELIPLELRLKALVTVEVSIPLVGTIKETLFEALLWQFTTPTISARILELTTKEKDESPPKIEPAVGGGGGSGAQNCEVSQIPGLDYTEPAFEIEIAASDDRSPANLFYSVGTSPGDSDIIDMEALGGSVTQIKEDLRNGIPLYFIVHACNTGGQCAQATCSLPTYDNTPTTGKIEVDYLSTSDPTKLSAAVKLYDDSMLTGQRWGVGYGQGVWGDQIGAWRSFTITKSSARSDGLGAFTAPREGRLGVAAFKVMIGADTYAASPETCAAECLKYDEVHCKSFNFDYGESKNCELLGEIEAVGQKNGPQVQISGRFHFYERLGVGYTAALSLDGLELIHNKLYFFNVEADNTMEYLGEISSHGILADFTPPDPGFAGEVLSDETFYEACHDKVVNKWHQNRCETATSRLPNHRIIQDGPTSMTVTNGMKHQVGGFYTRANTFISISFDGIHDDETGIYGYSWCAGWEYCDCVIHPHHDPHDHLYDSSEWTHTGTIYPVPPAPTVVNGILPDRRYYLSIRAFNRVAHGGTMSLTVCHTSPYGIDNTPPVFHGITGVEFDIETNDLQISYNTSDEQSAVVEADIGLGLTKFDVLVMNWERHNHTGTIEINPTIEDGVPAWPKIRAVNGVYLMTVGTADVPIIIDGSAPFPGEVLDGNDYGKDLDWTPELNEVCANWRDFYDPESGLKTYWWGVGSTPGETDLMAFQSVDTRTHQACASLATPLVHMSKYYTTVVAVHGGYRALNVSATSNGSQVDLTPPESGWFVDGDSDETGANGVPVDLEFTSEPARVDAQWGDFLDPESGIDEFMLSIYRRQLNDDGTYGDDQLMHGPDDIDKSQRAANFFHFHLIHGDVVWSKLTAINVAGGVTDALTDSFIVDLTPPVFNYLVDIWDGDSTTDVDRDFQTNQNSFSSGWGFYDNESGLDHFKMSIFETLHGTKQQIFPVGATWELLNSPSLTHHKVSGLSLSAGALYQTRVASVNRALLSSAYDTDGSIVDPSQPVILYVRVGVLDGSEEEKIDGYVWQADPEGIQASWKALDPESQIKDYWVCIGTSPGSSDIHDYTNMGSEEAGYINGLSLTLTNWGSKTPVYYVTVKARNGANSFSDTTTSTPVFVVDRDRAGYVTDGAEEGVDIDYQKDDITLMAHFSGFESQLNGIAHYLWAVGTSSGEDDVQPFLSAGIILKPEDQVRGGGLGGSGKARAILSLDCGTAYYVTVRAVTGVGDLLESYSDGVTVVCSRPVVDITRIGVDLSGGNTAVTAGETTYRQDKDALSAAWEVSDATCPVTSGWYQFGTVPSGANIRSATSYDPSYGNKASITPVGAGMPNILTVYAENAAGIMGYSISSSVIIDETPPDLGTVTCPEYLPGASTEIFCTWAFFLELESRIDRYEVRIGTQEGQDDTMAAVTLEGNRSEYRATGLTLDDTHQYYVTVTAYNSVGLKTDAYSGSIVVDASPPRTGVVVELSGLNSVSYSTEGSSASNCTGDECILAKDAVCQQSLTQVTAEWTPFSDPDSSIAKMEVAVGSNPGAGDVREYREVEVNPNGPIAIEGLDLTEVSQVFVAVKAYNKAGLTTVAISNGVYISKDSRGAVYDGEKTGQDLDYQTSLNTLYASWDFRGDPCPIETYEWSITRVDETVVQDFTDVDENTGSSNDNLQMMDGETYYVTVKATNLQNVSRIERSDGITVQREPLIPGLVRDGPVPGYDLNYQIADDEISANFEGFGVDRSSINAASSGNPTVEQTEEESAHQKVDKYEIAVGTDRLYARTRDNIIPFTDVGLNKTWTFYFVQDLVPKTGIYYVTVRASSANYAQVEVTSNGIRVGCDGGVTAGDVTVPAFINSPSKVLVEWSNFETRGQGIHLNFIGIGHKTDNTTAYQAAHALHCKDMIDSNSEVYASLGDVFTVRDWTVVDKDTFYKADELVMQHDEDYFATVVAMDETGECNKTTATFHVDLTDPIEGRLRAGPLYGMVMTYVDSFETFEVNWEGYSDPESDIAYYEVALFKAASCSVEDEDSLSVDVDWIRLNNSYRSYAIVELALRTNIPYYVHLRTTNNAGSSILTVSAPIIYDLSKISIGTLVDGHNYTEDLEFHGDNTTLP